MARRCVMCGKLVKAGLVTEGAGAILVMCEGCDGKHIGGYYIGVRRKDA